MVIRPKNYDLSKLNFISKLSTGRINPLNSVAYFQSEPYRLKIYVLLFVGVITYTIMRRDGDPDFEEQAICTTCLDKAYD